MTLIPTTAPRCCGAGCRQGDYPDACDCGIGATTACDVKRVAVERAKAIHGPYRKARRPLAARIVSFFWSKA